MTQIDAHPADLSGSADATFTFSATDSGSGVASFECRRDSAEGSAWSSCTSPKSYLSLADGRHSFEVRAVDQSGKADPSPAAFSWTIDTIAPAAPTISASDPASPANDNHPKLRGLAETGSTVTIYDAAGGPGECTPADATATGSASAFFSIGLPVTVSDNTTSRFRASATDAAGNTSACSNELDYAEVSRSQSPKGAVAGTVVRVRSGIAFVKLSCPAGSGCAGNLKLIVQLARHGRKLVGACPQYGHRSVEVLDCRRPEQRWSG